MANSRHQILDVQKKIILLDHTSEIFVLSEKNEQFVNTSHS